MRKLNSLFGAVLLTGLVSTTGLAAAELQEVWEAPCALALSPDGGELFTACARSGHVMELATAGMKLKRTMNLPDSPSGLAMAPDGTVLYVTCAAPVSHLAAIDLAQGKVTKSIEVGHTACSPVLSADGKTAYVCNRFSGDISVVDLETGKEVARIPVDREPVSAALTPDGQYLLVANHLHTGRADADVVAARISIVSTAERKVVKQLAMLNGSGLTRDIRVSPDGRYAAVVHVLARFQLPTTQLERGWMNTAGLTLIDLGARKLVNTVLLDNVDSGAANPWGAGWSADGKKLFVTHAGTHELSVIDFPGLLEKLSKIPEKAVPGAPIDYGAVSRVQADVPSDLAFLVGLRERVKLAGKGPRAAVARDARIYVADFFSGGIETVELRPGMPAKVSETLLGSEGPMSVKRRGEFLFNDAGICFQGWQSCASCHSEDARVDGLNWDLLNDGIGNPKNSKSLLYAHRTPPAMSMGVRDSAEMAVRSGIRNIQFTVQPEDVPVAMDEWLKSLRPVASPYVKNDRLSPAAVRGERLFHSSSTHCSSCHPTGMYTDLKHHEVGTAGPYDKPGEPFDTPSLVEIWRTAPYLHDGSAATLREVIVDRNPQDHHGKTSQLTPSEIDDLVAYLQTL